MELLRLREAARQLGISYPTLKQWIYRRRIRSTKTVGGHHRIPRSEIDRLLFRAQAKGHDRRKGRRQTESVSMAGLEHFISGRNQLVGRVTSLKKVGLLAEVRLDIGGQTITSIITSRASRDLGLKVDQRVAALIKATEVMIIRSPSTVL
jgi:molybdopterin-binding protein